MSAYAGVNVLVMGGLGFIGLNLVSELIAQQAYVIIVSRSQPSMAISWLNQISAGAQYSPKLRLGDIRSPETYQDVISSVDVIFNLAGKSGAAKSLIEAHTDMQTNVEGNLALLETIRHKDHKPRVVFISSRLVYGPTGAVPAGEDQPLKPTSIYGLHKLSVEHYYRLYGMHYGVPYSIMRLTNPYGPYQLPDRQNYGIANSFIIHAIKSKTITVYGKGHQLRDYVFIGDVVEALLNLGSNPIAIGQTFNIGYGRSISLSDMAMLIVKLANSGQIEYVPWPEVDKMVETGDFLCNIDRARTLLGWQPVVGWEEGFQRTISTYRRIL